MVEELLTIKLYAPPLRPGLVNRPRLVQKLNQGYQQGSQLTILSAPAGYGKTTLVLEWLAGLSRPYAWLSLDRTDNHPVLFFRYLVAALQRLVEQSRDKFPERLESFFPVTQEEVQPKLAGLLNQLSQVASQFVLVLDDYHTIVDLSIHQAMEFIIEHQPPQMHLVITTRQDPLLPLSRLRSRGKVTEVRLGDLRFSTEEAASFLNGTMGLALVDNQIASLEERTEGCSSANEYGILQITE